MRNRHMDDRTNLTKMPVYDENVNIKGDKPVNTETKCNCSEKCNPEKPLNEIPTQTLEKVLYLRYTQRLEQIMAELAPLMEERDILMSKLRSFQEMDQNKE